MPYLYEEAFQWYESFDQLGELLTNPNPTAILDRLEDVLKALTDECQWPADRVHLFGFAQGGSVALEFALKGWKKQKRLASVISIDGPLLSYPTLKPEKRSSCPVLFFHRAAPSSVLAALQKGFEDVKEIKIAGEGMPRSKAEWAGVMMFWGRVLSMRQEMEGLYPVISGGPVPPTVVEQ